MLEIWEFPGKQKVLSSGVTWLHMHVKKRALTVVGMTDWMGRVGGGRQEIALTIQVRDEGELTSCHSSGESTN